MVVITTRRLCTINARAPFDHVEVYLQNTLFAEHELGPEALRAHLEAEYDENVKPQLDDLRKQLKSLQIDTVLGAFNVKAAIPPLVASGGAALGLTVNPILAAAGGLALALIPLIRDKQKQAQEATKSSPVSYLLSVEEKLNPGTLTSRISTAVRHFVLAA